MEITWECIVVGGGAAGLSAALVMGRARRRVLVVDAGRQSNLPTDGIGGLLGHDHRPPSELYAAGHRELAGYPSVEVRAGEVVDAGRAGESAVTLVLADGARETTRRVLLATGMEYRHPELPGIRERWGRSVFHCPFCHGWENRERPLGVLDRGADGARRAVLLRAWSDDVTLLSDGPAGLDAGDARRLETLGVEVDERRVAGLAGTAPGLTGAVFADGSERPLGGLQVPVVLHQRSPLAERLGAAAADPNPIFADGLVVDAMARTTADGVSAAGDVTGDMPSVANAIAAGSRAGAMIVHDLMDAAAAGPA